MNLFSQCDYKVAYGETSQGEAGRRGEFCLGFIIYGES